MAGKMYAWSTFNVDVDEWGKAHSHIEPGEAVDAKKLGVTDDEFDGLVEVGAVREMEYPDVAPGQSPTEYYREQANAALELVMSPTGQVEEVTPEPEAEEAEPGTKPAGTGTK